MFSVTEALIAEGYDEQEAALINEIVENELAKLEGDEVVQRGEYRDFILDAYED